MSKIINMKALVVDDNEVNAIFLVHMLEQHGIHAEHAEDGDQAVLMCENKVYDMIFIDHMMPSMNGAQTIQKIRNTSIQTNQTVMIALTSDITNSLRCLYEEAGANLILEKPLSVPALSRIIHQWYPDFHLKPLPKNPGEILSTQFKLDNIIKNMNKIDYSAGMKYAGGSPVQFFKILESAVKDLKCCIQMIINSNKQKSITQLQSALHKLKNVYNSIGALALTEDTKSIENYVSNVDSSKLEDIIYDSVIRIEQFKLDLEQALNQFYIIMKLEDTDNKYNPMTKEEYEHCLLSTIYYIKRYDYDNIILELERLISMGPKSKNKFELVLDYIKNYNYEKALEHMIKFLDETG